METQEALYRLFTEKTVGAIAEITGTNYNTVATWKFKFKNQQLSMEKQIEILTKANFKLINTIRWK
jgi:hypothetical protein